MTQNSQCRSTAERNKYKKLSEVLWLVAHVSLMTGAEKHPSNRTVNRTLNVTSQPNYSTKWDLFIWSKMMDWGFNNNTNNNDNNTFIFIFCFSGYTIYKLNRLKSRGKKNNMVKIQRKRQVIHYITSYTLKDKLAQKRKLLMQPVLMESGVTFDSPWNISGKLHSKTTLHHSPKKLKYINRDWKTVKWLHIAGLALSFKLSWKKSFYTLGALVHHNKSFFFSSKLRLSK